VDRNISLSSFNLSIKARGATVPFSPGLVEMFRNKDCKAETSVGGDVGMGCGPLCRGEELEGSVVVPDVEGLRSGFLLTGRRGAVCLPETGGPAKVLEGRCESTFWIRRSRNGVQEYNACRTELA
jgi:hypothetical protein